MNTIKLKPIDPEVEFPKVEKMLYDLAWRFTRQYPIPFEEAKSQAYWGFVQACENYDWSKGTSFATYCYQVTFWKLKDLIMSRSKDAEHLTFIEIDEDLCGTAKPERSDLHDLAADLPHDCQEILKMLLETPAELVGRRMSPRQFFQQVRELFMWKTDKTREQVDAACEMLRAKFQEEWL